MSQFTELFEEYTLLKSELFAHGNFIVIDPSEDEKFQRYNQLLGYFHPEFRTRGWESPV